MAEFDEDTLKIKAALEFGSEYTYTIRSSGLGMSLRVEAENKKAAHIIREKIPSEWEGLYVIVIYTSDRIAEDLIPDNRLPTADLYEPHSE